MADYTKAVEQTYIDVAVRLLTANPATACIVLASVQHGRDKFTSPCIAEAHSNMRLEEWLRSEKRLPSWVPDWRWSSSIILAEPICPHRSHGETITKLEILEEDHLVLRIEGMEVDTIAACSRPLQCRDFYSNKMPKVSPTTIERLWHEVCEKQHFDSRDRYLNGQTAFFAFVQTLSNGCVQAAGHDCMPYEDIPETEWLQEAAAHILATVGTSGNILEEMESLAGKKEGQNNWGRWAASASEGRVFARTEIGYYVLGPAVLEAGDKVCVLFGSKVPFCLRPMGRRYMLVGECYVHGLMKGEALDMLSRGSLQKKTFDIV